MNQQSDGALKSINKYFSILFLFGTTLLGACAQQLEMKYITNPPGAKLTLGGMDYGYAPLTLWYNLSSQDISRGSMSLQGPEAKWVSGASIALTTIHADIRRHGLKQQIVIERPDAPGKEIDIQFALEREKIEIMERQTRAMERQARNAEIDSLINLQNQLLSPQKPCVRSIYTGSIQC